MCKPIQVKIQTPFVLPSKRLRMTVSRGQRRSYILSPALPSTPSRPMLVDRLGRVTGGRGIDAPPVHDPIGRPAFVLLAGRLSFDSLPQGGAYEVTHE